MFRVFITRNLYTLKNIQGHFTIKTIKIGGSTTKFATARVGSDIAVRVFGA